MDEEPIQKCHSLCIQFTLEIHRISTKFQFHTLQSIAERFVLMAYTLFRSLKKSVYLVISNAAFVMIRSHTYLTKWQWEVIVGFLPVVIRSNCIHPRHHFLMIVILKWKYSQLKYSLKNKFCIQRNRRNACQFVVVVFSVLMYCQLPQCLRVFKQVESRRKEDSDPWLDLRFYLQCDCAHRNLLMLKLTL